MEYADNRADGEQVFSEPSVYKYSDDNYDLLKPQGATSSCASAPPTAFSSWAIHFLKLIRKRVKSRRRDRGCGNHALHVVLDGHDSITIDHPMFTHHIAAIACGQAR